MENTELEKLRWALRHLLTHPLLSPGIMADEWEMEIEEAIEIYSLMCSTIMESFGFKDSHKIKLLNDKCFKKLCSFKKTDAPSDE
jgi:hypothetical protein